MVQVVLSLASGCNITKRTTPAFTESLWSISSIEWPGTKLQGCVMERGQSWGTFVALHTGVCKILKRDCGIIRTLLLEENKFKNARAEKTNWTYLI